MLSQFNYVCCRHIHKQKTVMRERNHLWPCGRFFNTLKNDHARLGHILESYQLDNTYEKQSWMENFVLPGNRVQRAEKKFVGNFFRFLGLTVMWTKTKFRKQ